MHAGERLGFAPSHFGDQCLELFFDFMAQEGLGEQAGQRRAEDEFAVVGDVHA